MIKDQKIEDFLDNLASNSPTPGGGSVAALSAAMAASLVEMVCNLTIGKKNYSEVQVEMMQIAERASDLTKEFLDLGDKDSEAFEEVMKAYKSKDIFVKKQSLLKAIEVPEKTRELAREVYAMASVVARIGNKNTYSDAMSAEYLANAAIESAQENIETNKKTLAELG